MELLRRQLRNLPEPARADARSLLERERDVLQRFRAVTGRKLSAMRIRIHGDYHLGQVLFTGNDFVIMDFEGEPERPISERRLKRSALRDVAGMLRSYHYACEKALADATAAGVVPVPRVPEVREALDVWYAWVTHAFMSGYFGVAEAGKFVPKAQRDRDLLLGVFVLEKALYELRYELNNRPDWVGIPLRGVLRALASDEGANP
jgi:maltose alpha-D-glucosyltransferase/alpha-amylase